MAAIYSNGGNRWNILGFNFTKRDVLSSVYKISMLRTDRCKIPTVITETLTVQTRHKHEYIHEKNQTLCCQHKVVSRRI